MDKDQHATENHDEGGATPYEKYTSGQKDPYGRIIKTVIGRHREFVVYITAENAVGWHYDQLPERLRPALSEFQLLTGIANSTLGRKQIPKVAALLGPALYAALLSSEGENAVQHFEGARTYIYSKSTQVSRLSYVLFSLLFGCLIVGITLFFSRYIAASESLRAALPVGI